MKYKFSGGSVNRISNVLKISYNKTSPVTISDMKEITEIREKLFGNSIYASLIDIRGEVELTKEAIEYATTSKGVKKLRIAEVLLVNNFAEKPGVHTYVKFFRFTDNVTVMTNEDNALHWLEREFAKFKAKKRP